MLFLMIAWLVGCGNANQTESAKGADEKKMTAQAIQAQDQVQSQPEAVQLPSMKEDASHLKQEKQLDSSSSTAVSSSAFHPFYVYSDKSGRGNHYIPSGFMPDGKCLTFNDIVTTNCYSGQSCIQITYDVGCSQNGQKWGGIYWLSPANNWGNTKGGFNLTGAEKLTFWARGEKGGEQIQEFIVGGITGNFADTDKMVMGPVILSNEWRQYTVDLRGKDLSYISGGFAWSTSVDVNRENVTFYLDEIKFE